jgi:hypothetical protein
VRVDDRGVVFRCHQKIKVRQNYVAMVRSEGKNIMIDTSQYEVGMGQRRPSGVLLLLSGVLFSPSTVDDPSFMSELFGHAATSIQVNCIADYPEQIQRDDQGSSAEI